MEVSMAGVHASFARGWSNGRPVECLLDTGAAVSLVHAGVARAAQLRELQRPRTALKAADGNALEVLAVVQTDLELEVNVRDAEGSNRPARELVRVEAGVVENLPVQVLLGIDWLKANCEVWNFEVGEVKLRSGQTLTLMHPGEGRAPSAELTRGVAVAAEECLLAPGETRWLAVTWQHEDCGDVWLELRTEEAAVGPGAAWRKLDVRELWNASVTARVAGAAELLVQNCSLERVRVAEDQPIADVYPTWERVATEVRVPDEPLWHGSAHCVGVVRQAETLDEQVSRLLDATDAKQLDVKRREAWRHMLLRNRAACFVEGGELPKCNFIQHRIQLKAGVTGLRERPHQYPFQQLEAFRRTTAELMAMDVLVRWDGETAFNIPMMVLPKKAPGQFRIVGNYVRLNSVTVAAPQFAMPNSEQTMESVAGRPVLSTWDCPYGFNQIELEERSRQFTAFSVPGMGTYAYKRMPLGITGGPATFNRCMHLVLREVEELRNEEGKVVSACASFVDDIIIGSDTEAWHLKHTELVLQAFVKAGMQLSLTKSKLMPKEVVYLGRTIRAGRRGMEEAKVLDIMATRPPQTAAELHEWLGKVAYNSAYIPNEKMVAAPLWEMLHGRSENDAVSAVEVMAAKEQIINKAHVLRKMRMSDTKHRKRGLQWTDEAREAFEELKRLVSRRPMLVFPDYGKPFVVTSDASRVGVGGVLSQMHDGVLVPVAFTSRALREPEKLYSVWELEALAAATAVLRFRRFIDMCPTDVVLHTDHRTLATAMQTGRATSTLHSRWLAIIGAYCKPEHVVYVEGESNRADYFSRHPMMDDAAALSPEEVEYFELAVLWDAWCGEDERGLIAPALATRVVVNMLPKDMAEAQELDTELSLVRRLRRGELSLKELTPEIRGLADGTTLRQNVLFKLTLRNQWKVMVPLALRRPLLEEAHDSALGAHMSAGATTRRLMQHFWWTGMRKEVAAHVSACQVCEVVGRGPQMKTTKVLTGPVGGDACEPLEVLCVDVKGPLPVTRHGNRFIVAFIDVATRVAMTWAVPNHKADKVAECMKEWWMVHGVPVRVISDHGSEFWSTVFEKFLKALSVSHTGVVPYSPWMNGKVERFNGTLGLLLKKMTEQNKLEWDENLHLCVAAYNFATHSALGCSPHEALTGRKARQPLDVAFDIPVAQRLSTVWRICAEMRRVAKGGWHQKDSPEHRVFAPGEWVLLRAHVKVGHPARPTGPSELVKVDGGLPTVSVWLRMNGTTVERHASQLLRCRTRNGKTEKLEADGDDETSVLAILNSSDGVDVGNHGPEDVVGGDSQMKAVVLPGGGKIVPQADSNP